MNGMWTFTEKKNTKKPPKNLEKKHTSLSKKIKKNPPNPEWMAHELFLEKKNTPLYFFFPASGKKKHNFTIWMNEWPMNFFGKKKKIRYLWGGYTIFNHQKWGYFFQFSSTKNFFLAEKKVEVNLARKNKFWEKKVGVFFFVEKKLNKKNWEGSKNMYPPSHSNAPNLKKNTYPPQKTLKILQPPRSKKGLFLGV